jgi:hypothetical protein
MDLKELRKRIFRGDIVGLFRLFVKDEKAMQPSEVAQIFLNLPAASAVTAFQTFPEKNQIIYFLIWITLLKSRSYRIFLKSKRQKY